MTTETLATPEIPAAVRKATTERQYRSARYDRAKIDEEARTVELAFASPEPYERWWGIEVLDCTPAAVDLSRLNNRHPLLLNHDPERQIGVVEQAWVDADRICRARVRFSRSALGEEIFRDVVDGIRELVSVGYQIDDMVLESRTDDQATYRVTRWGPFEVSIVPIPADTKVGVGRSLAAEAAVRSQPSEMNMSETTTAAPAASAQPDIRVIETQAAQRERDRASAIRAMGAAFQLGAEAEQAVQAGAAVDAFRATVLEALQQRGKLTPAAASPEIGMSDREKRQFSLTRLMYAILEPSDRAAQQRAAFEFECSVAARKLMPVDESLPDAAARLSGYRVPHDILASPAALERAAAEQAAMLLMRMRGTRDLSVGTTTAGGHLVATQLLASSFIDLLRNRMVLAGLGATMLDGLVGNLAIPSQTGGASTYWVAEATAVTESEATFGQVTMSPKTVGMFTDYSRRTLLQTTPAIEALVRADLANGIAVEIDRAGIAGSGSGGQPQGIINTAGIGAVAGGTNGAAPTYLNMISLEEQVALANADIGSMALLTNAKMRAQLRGTQQFASTNGVPVWQSDNTVLGYRGVVSNSVPSNLTKGSSSGVCSALVFGKFDDVLLGMWGGLDLILDTSALATSGGRRLVALQDVDVKLRRAASFAAMLDALRT